MMGCSVDEVKKSEETLPVNALNEFAKSRRCPGKVTDEQIDAMWGAYPKTDDKMDLVTFVTMFCERVLPHC